MTPDELNSRIEAAALKSSVFFCYSNDYYLGFIHGATAFAESEYRRGYQQAVDERVVFNLLKECSDSPKDTGQNIDGFCYLCGDKSQDHECVSKEKA